MKAIICSEFGPVDNLTLESVVPRPLLAGEVRINVHSCGVNFPDILIVQGKYQQKPPLPFSPGGEVAGDIIELGEDVTVLEVGQRVMATIFWGGMAEQAVAPTSAVIPIPDSLDYNTASVFQGGHLTSYHALKQRAQLRRGETLLVLGAAGGVGTAAVQLGKAMGAHVIAAASTQEKCNFALENGADEAINYNDQDLKKAVKELTGGAGADVIYDPVGGEVFDAATRCIAWNGRLLVVGFASGTIPHYPANLALLKGCAVVGVFYQAFTEKQPADAQQNIVELMQMVTDGRVEPKIDKTFRLEQAADALNYVGSRRAIGKVVVRVNDG